MLSPDLKTFAEHFESHKTQLIYTWIVSDTDTPVSAFLKLGQDEPYSFLLESVEGGAILGRYTILGYDPDLIWSYADGQVKVNDAVDPARALDSLRHHRAASNIDVVAADLPPMASSGLFGYFGYDVIREAEVIPDKNPDTLGMPDAVFTRPRLLVIFDNVMHKICVVSPVYSHAGNTKESASIIYKKVSETIESCIAKLKAPLAVAASSENVSQNIEFTSNMTEGQFHGMVNAAKEYIAAGDIFQVVLSQRFSADFTLPAFDFYRSLRRINPSPFLFYLQFPSFSIAGSSPEVLVRVRDDEVTIRPIAGTTKRGNNDEEDKERGEALLADPKEYSEHLMLLDLGRNDIGRIAKTGSVKVTDKFTIEKYSHVMHIVSNVQGQLRDDVESLDALLAGFPAGTVSGAPKIRAMEIIDELEPVKRKFYAGCVGYLAGNGNIDTCIALRTALIKDGKIHIQAGAGITAASVLESEYLETVHKSQAVVRAAEDAIEQHFLTKPSSQAR
jgi:anthranilate synthase component 1